MEFRDIKDVLTFAAFRPEPDNPRYNWQKRFPGQRSLLINVSRSQVVWGVLNKKGRIEDTGSADGEFMDVAATMADEWRNQTDNGWVGVSLNTRFIVTLEHNLSRKSGSEETIRTNPKSILGTKYDRAKRYALYHNPETSASLLLGCDESLVQTVEDCLRNHNMKTARICCGLFAMTSSLLERISEDDSLKSQDLIVITWVDGSLFILRQKVGQWQEVRCRSGLPPKDANAVAQMIKPFFSTADGNTRVLFMADRPDNQFSQEYLPQLENFHITDLTEPNQLWNTMAKH